MDVARQAADHARAPEDEIERLASRCMAASWCEIESIPSPRY